MVNAIKIQPLSTAEQAAKLLSSIQRRGNSPVGRSIRDKQLLRVPSDSVGSGVNAKPGIVIDAHEIGPSDYAFVTEVNPITGKIEAAGVAAFGKDPKKDLAVGRLIGSAGGSKWGTPVNFAKESSNRKLRFVPNFQGGELNNTNAEASVLGKTENPLEIVLNNVRARVRPGASGSGIFDEKNEVKAIVQRGNSQVVVARDLTRASEQSTLSSLAIDARDKARAAEDIWRDQMQGSDALGKINFALRNADIAYRSGISNSYKDARGKAA